MSLAVVATWGGCSGQPPRASAGLTKLGLQVPPGAGSFRSAGLGGGGAGLYQRRAVGCWARGPLPALRRRRRQKARLCGRFGLRGSPWAANRSLGFIWTGHGVRYVSAP